MGDFSVNDAPARDPSKRRISRAVKIGVLLALSLPCFAFCFAVAVVSVAAFTFDFAGVSEFIFHGADRAIAECFLQIVLVWVILLALAISLLVQMTFMGFIFCVGWWLDLLHNFGFQ